MSVVMECFARTFVTLLHPKLCWDGW